MCVAHVCCTHACACAQLRCTVAHACCTHACACAHVRCTVACACAHVCCTHACACVRVHCTHVCACVRLAHTRCQVCGRCADVVTHSGVASIARSSCHNTPAQSCNELLSLWKNDGAGGKVHTCVHLANIGWHTS